MGAVLSTLLLVAVVTPAIASSGTPTTRLYVSDERGGDVVVVDPAARRVVERIAVGKRPRGIQIAPDDTRLYVALSGSPQGGPHVDESRLPPPDRRYDGIGVVDLRTQRLISTYPSGADPEAFALSHDGHMLYVSNEDSAGLSAIDLTRGTRGSSARVGTEPEGVAVSGDNRIVYVTCETANSVYVVAAPSMRVLATIPTAKRPRAILLVGRSHLGYATDEFGAALTVFSTTDYHVIRTIALGDPRSVRPMGIASHDGEVLDVTTGRFGALLEVDAHSGRILRSIPHVGARPWGVALSADGTQAYTANGPSGDVSIVDLQSGRVVARIPVGGSPWGIVAASSVPLSAQAR
jgi:YVTN family beta-propeller protein